jgi:hypothetical protein
MPFRERKNVETQQIPEGGYTPQELLRGTTYSSKVWNVNRRKGVTVVMKEGQWHGYTAKGGRIEVGANPVPDAMKEFFGFDKNVPDRLIKQYILSHENMHHILFDIIDHPTKYPGFQNVLTVTHALRRGSGVGLSMLGGHPMYGAHESNTAHEEDLVELLNRYCIKPEILKAHLQYLVDTDERVLTRKGLTKLQQPVADLLYKKVALIVEQFLENNV